MRRNYRARASHDTQSWRRGLPCPWTRARDGGHSGQGSQLPPRGTGLRLGTARTGLARGLGGRLTELQRLTRHKALRGQAQPPLAEQPQRTKEEPYFSQRPILNAIRMRLRRT